MSDAKSAKGCYNCMKRRIICDRTEPHCLKCQKKGVPCPGMGIRYRFNDGIAARGKFKGIKTLSTDIAETSTRSKLAEGIAIPKITRWVNNDAENGRKRKPRNDSSGKQPNEKHQTVAAQEDTSNEIIPHSSRPILSHYNSTLDSTRLADFSCITESEDILLGSDLAFTLIPSPEILDPQARFLFSHFSTHVSPVMILFDGEENGYRRHVLPFAVYDSVVQRTVSVTAAFHLSKWMPELRAPAEAGRAAIIRKLTEDAAVNSDNVFSETTRATIILLIIADLVTGTKEVLILYRMLLSILSGRKKSQYTTPLTEFLDYQSRVIEFFARPVTSESEGITRLSQVSQPLIDLFEVNAGEQCKDSARNLSLLLYNEAFSRARDIYLLRAQSNGSVDEHLMAQLIEEFKWLLLELKPSSEGAHTLVWPYFIAAAESRTQECRVFFYKRLNHIWSTTGYRNVCVAMDAVQKIWEQQGRERWTASLPDITTIIM